MIRIDYTIEQTDGGWLVWRTLPGREPYVVGSPGDSKVRPRPHSSRHAAQQTVDVQRAADKSAAGRLGVEVVHDQGSNDRGRQCTNR